MDRPSIILAIILCCKLFCVEGSAGQIVEQSRPILQYGVYASGDLSHHRSNFSELPRVPNCCIDFQGANAAGYAFGVVLDAPIANRLSFQFRGGYLNQSALLKEENYIGDVIIDDEILPSYSEHTIDATLTLLEIQSFIRYRLFDRFPIYFQSGMSLGSFLKKSFIQKETLVRPSGVTFTNGSRVRNEVFGEIPDVYSFQPYLQAGISYDVLLSKKWTFSPELIIGYPLNSVVKGLRWNVDIIRLGAVLLMNPVEISEPTPLAIPRGVIDEPPVAPKDFTVNLDAIAITPEGKRDRDLHIQIDEVRYSEMYPLLPYIFFSEGEADLLKTRLALIRKDETKMFDESALHSNTLSIYSQVLNIIGARLRKYTDATITITGYDNALRGESQNLHLSRERTEAVKKYLTDVWEISSDRIRAEAHHLPVKATNNETNDGQVENRRAEISSDDFRIILPVRIDEIKRFLSHSRIEFFPDVRSSRPLRDWNFQLQQGKNSFLTQRAKELPSMIPWNPSDDLAQLTDDQLIATFFARNEDERMQSSTLRFPVSIHSVNTQRFEKRNNVRIERFGLILFDFDKSVLNQLNKRILDSVKTHMTSMSKVIIQGYADRTGTRQYNKSLAADRCREVRAYLGEKVSDPQVVLEPIGSDQLLFNNDIPEGRQYNRIVYIIIETPE